jgi:type I restriction enzyme, S subunit
MKRYSTYKSSNIEILGEIPKHWEIKKLKYVTNLKSGESINSEYIEEVGVYPVYGGNGLRGYTNAYTHEGNYVLIGRQGALCGNINYATGKFWASEHAVVATIRNNENFEWLGELLRAINLNQYTVSAAQPGLAVERIKELKIPTPPINEQNNIAQFLLIKTQEIDSLIFKKQKLIELLKEERAAIINQAVTKGIDPNVEMKDSGIEWLGKIPAHWDVKRFKYCASIANGQVDPKDPSYLSMPLIAPNHIESGTGKLLSIETVLEQGAESGKYLYDIGNILYSKIRPNLKKACIPQFVGLCSADMYPIRIKRDLRPEFLLNFLLSEVFTNFAIERSMRVAMPKINREDLNNCNLVLPPLSEQDNIIQYIKDEIGKLDDAVAKAEREIELIKEYLTTLISEVVSGKIDVREEVAVWI